MAVPEVVICVADASVTLSVAALAPVDADESTSATMVKLSSVPDSHVVFNARALHINQVHRHLVEPHRSIRLSVARICKGNFSGVRRTHTVWLAVNMENQGISLSSRGVIVSCRSW